MRRRQDRLAPTGAELCPGTRAAKRFERRGAETVQVTASGQGSWTRRSLLMQCDRETPRSGPASATTTTTPTPMCKAGSLCSLSWREPVPQDWRSLGPGFASSWNLCARAFPKGKLDRFPGRGRRAHCENKQFRAPRKSGQADRWPSELPSRSPEGWPCRPASEDSPPPARCALPGNARPAAPAACACSWPFLGKEPPLPSRAGGRKTPEAPTTPHPICHGPIKWQQLLPCLPSLGWGCGSQVPINQEP